MDDDSNKVMKIRLNDMNPYIRRASNHVIEGGLKTSERINPHYQLHYVVGGEGSITIEGTVYHVTKGDMVFWGPGERHVIESAVDQPLHVYGVQFDLTQNNRDTNYQCLYDELRTFDHDMITEIVSFEECGSYPAYIKILDGYEADFYMKELVKVFSQNTRFNQGRMSGILKSFLMLALYNADKFRQHNASNRYDINEVIRYLDLHYSLRLTNKDLGERFSYHPNYLNSLIIDHTGYSIQQYLINIRMNKAMDLLQNSNKSITEIAEAVGNYDIHYFSRLFKNKVGVSPKEVR